MTIEETAAAESDVGIKHSNISETLTNGQVGGLHRRLGNRQIQITAIGGTIGTAIFVSIGQSLITGGPGSLFLAFTLYACVVGLANNSLAEMSTFMPVAGGFIRLAGYWVDDALGFVAGWNFFFFEALLIPFEVTALTLILSFWHEGVTDTGPSAVVCVASILFYGYAAIYVFYKTFVFTYLFAHRCLNLLTVKYYGETEFWLSGGKLVLIFILFSFTFVTMVGGNPQHDAFGFRYWSIPGSFAEFRSTGTQGRFEGFLSCLWTAAFTISGPEFISMMAAEAKRPSIYLKSAFKTIYWRFLFFFSLGALAVGIVIPYNDPTLADIYFGSGSGSSTAAGSPYVIAMRNMGIPILPHIVNALVMTSILSAGNSYTYCATRSLYGLAIAGRAPRFLRYCTKHGVPCYCLAVVMLFPLLAFLQLSNTSAKVLGLLVSLITGGGMVTFIIINLTFLNYYQACKVQGIDRKTRPYYGYLQPYGSYAALTIQFAIAIFSGYTAFAPFKISDFFINYTMQFIAVPLFLAWKFFRKTRYIRPEEVDLIWERPLVDAYETSLIEPPETFWGEIFSLIRIRKSG